VVLKKGKKLSPAAKRFVETLCHEGNEGGAGKRSGNNPRETASMHRNASAS
jgi:hypothetical protein